jgi:tetratricopeptide (TPR) repeat protein
LKKEPLVFLITIAILAGLWFLSGSDSAAAGSSRGRAARTQDAQPPIEAKRTPGRFLALTEVTWAPNASNIFETPTETRDLPPLDIAPPPFPRLPHPGPPIPIQLSAKAKVGLRRTIVPTAQAAPTDGNVNGEGSGGAAAAASDPASGAGAATQPTESAGLVPIGQELSAVDRIKLSMDAELKRNEEALRAKQSEEDRRKALDKIVFADQTVQYGELAPGTKNESRYQIKADLDKLRTDPTLTEPERNDRLKKFELRWREEKRGKLGKATTYFGNMVQQVTFADTPENRYRQRQLTASKTDVAVQTELVKEIFEARLFKLAAEHLLAMRKAGLSSVESVTMLADALHELFDYNQELEVLRKAVQDFPESAPLLSRLGRLQALLGLFEDARGTFASVLAKNPSDPLANTGMAALLLRSGGDAQQAILHLREALNLARDPVRVDTIRLLTAEAYLSLGDFRNAHETVDLVLQRSNVTAPERQRLFERAFALAAVAALGQGQLAEARTRAEEGAKRYPLSGQLTLLLGIVQIQQGELAAARSKLAIATELDPLLTGHAQVALALLEEAAADDNRAVAAAEAGALTANPAASELRLPFGRALLHVGDLGRASEQLLAALDAEPRSADALAALGDVAYAGNNLQDAIRFYDRAAAIEPAFPQLAARRIITQVRRRKLAEAEDLQAKAGTTDLRDPFLQAALAYFQYSKGNDAEALQILEKLGQAGAGKLSEYAQDVHKAVNTHQNRTMWNEGFSRLGGGQLGREWKWERGTGVNIGIKDQGLTFEGVQARTSDAPTMVWQERPGDKVHGFSVDLDLPPQPGVYAGIGVMVMNQTARPGTWPGAPNPKEHGNLAAYTGLQVALSPDSKLVYRVLVKGVMGEWQPVPVTSYAGGPVTLEIRFYDPREGILEVLVNRESVLRQTLADLKRFKRTVELQIFCQAQIDRKVHFTADNVVIVTLKETR